MVNLFSPLKKLIALLEFWNDFIFRGFNDKDLNVNNYILSCILRKQNFNKTIWKEFDTGNYSLVVE